MSFKFNFSANTGYLWKELPFLERLAMAKKYDFETVEFHDEPYKENIKKRTVSRYNILEGDKKIKYISKMISGEQVTPESIKYATTMVNR